TMSLTNLRDATAERLIAELFRGEIVYVPYARPGFPLARTVSGMVDRMPRDAVGLALAHHGLMVWGHDPRECYTRLLNVVNRIEDHLETSRRSRAVLGATARPIPAAESRRRCAELVLPVVRGALASPEGGRGILNFDDAGGILTALAAERLRAVLATIANAEPIEVFRFIPEREVFAFEHWPLERRKLEEQDARGRASLLLPRHVAVVIGSGSGIGRAAARRFAEEGAHVVVADVDAVAGEAVATEIGAAFPDRAIAVPVDVRDDQSLAHLVRRTVLEFGGLDCLFYTAG